MTSIFFTFESKLVRLISVSGPFTVALFVLHICLIKKKGCRIFVAFPKQFFSSYWSFFLFFWSRLVHFAAKIRRMYVTLFWDRGLSFRLIKEYVTTCSRPLLLHVFCCQRGRPGGEQFFGATFASLFCLLLQQATHTATNY